MISANDLTLEEKLAQLVEEGCLPMERVDEAIERVRRFNRTRLRRVVSPSPWWGGGPLSPDGDDQNASY